jgi:hypothetical protein
VRALIRIRKEPYYRRAAFEAGLKRVGFQLAESLKPEGPDDWLVLWNRKAGTDEQQADAWEARGGTVIVAENGYLAKVEKTVYAISVHGHNGSGWFPAEAEDRFTPLGFPLKPWRKGGTEIVLRTQRGIGSVLMASPTNWIAQTVARLKVRPGLPIRVIPHPGNHPPKVPPEQDLRKADVFVTWASAMGVRALIEGIPVFYGAPHWICEKGATPLIRWPLAEIDSRESALHKMAHGQWHFDEIATGEPFKRIIEHRKEAKW